MKRLSVIKIGGNVIDNPLALEKFLDGLARIERPFILVHGGGALATKLSRRLGVESKMVDGRRITDGEMIKIATMVYAGLINKQLAASLQKRGINAIGLCGADASAIVSRKREDKNIEWGYVGDVIPNGVNASFINGLINISAVPVFCAITSDREGNLLNTNADTVAEEIASAMAEKYPEEYEVKLIYCFEKQGVMMDADNNESLIKEMNKEKFTELKERGIIVGGMLPKLENAFKALSRGVKQVIVKQADNLLNSIQTTITL